MINSVTAPPSLRDHPRRSENEMNKLANALSSILWVSMPMLFIGSAYFVIPKFELIFEDMLGEAPLPKLTEIIVSTPLFLWLLIAFGFAVFNYYISRKEQNGILCAASLIAIFLISGTIIIGLFLPVSGGIIKAIDEPQTKSEPAGSGQPM